jgi:hypothetical protein
MTRCWSPTASSARAPPWSFLGGLLTSLLGGDGPALDRSSSTIGAILGGAVVRSAACQAIGGTTRRPPARSDRLRACRCALPRPQPNGFAQLAERVGCQKSIGLSCCTFVFVDQAAEDITAVELLRCR